MCLTLFLQALCEVRWQPLVLLVLLVLLQCRHMGWLAALL
jgi:hypothetical protein